jgi:hypothetical protein
VTDKIFLTKTECLEMFQNTDIYVFGISRDTSEFLNEMGGKINVVAYVDNYKCGENNFYNHKGIISVDAFIQERGNLPIIITAGRYAKMIQNQLMDSGLEAGKDFFVWDDNCLFHSDEHITRLIDRFKQIWKEEPEDSGSQILIPFDNVQYANNVQYAYFANYMAKKYGASIMAYCKFGFDRSNASSSVEAIFKSFHVKDIIDVRIDDAMEKEADQLESEIWPTLYFWGDWKQITIYGVHYGTTMLRDYFRRYIPSFDIRGEKMHEFLKSSIRLIVFWNHYFKNHNVKVVLLSDGTNWEGYIRDTAIANEIPVYATGNEVRRLKPDYVEKECYQYFDKMWEQLSDEEKTYGLSWAKKHIAERISGDTKEVNFIDRKNFAFGNKPTGKRVLKENNKLKIMICPHSFEEDSYWYGEHIFDDTYFSWLCHLGELSEKTPDYDWYLKPHPSAVRRDEIIINMFLEKYPNITKLEKDVSPLQLKEEGIKFALTVCGTLGHEYPAIGIQVINAGLNPHSKFDFCWNPKSKKEFDDLIFNLDKLPEKNDENGLLRFYCLNYLYYNWEYASTKKFFFDSPQLRLDVKQLGASGYERGTWIYEEYLKEYTLEKHQKICDQIGGLFDKADSWRPDVLYRKENEDDEKEGGSIHLF